MSELTIGSNTSLEPTRSRRITDLPGGSSAVSWAAIFAGAAGAAGLSLLFLFLGTGLGFTAVSPWAMEGISASTFGIAVIAWLSVTQLVASGTGGYLAGRTRTKWTTANPHERFFRDAAHGFITWAVASLLTAAVMTSVGSAIVGTGVRAGAAVAEGAGSAVASVADASNSEQVSNNMEYFIDSLFRSGSSDAGSAQGTQQQADAQQFGSASPVRDSSEIPSGEVMRIFTRALQTGTLPEQDQRYIAQLIAQRTDLSQQQAQQRVSSGFEQIKTTLQEAETTVRTTADEAREASAYASFWMFVTLLIGAVVACVMAVVGGHKRDKDDSSSVERQRTNLS